MTPAAALLLLWGAAVVVDGDTLRIGPYPVRLWGIDAPELPSVDGVRAKAALAAAVTLGGGEVTCVGRGMDRHGRVVARCFDRAERDLAALMVATGHARDWPAYSGGFYREDRR